MLEITQPDEIRYEDLARRLRKFPQRIVPFLGAGVSLSERKFAARAENDAAAEGEVRDAVRAASRLTNPQARAFLEWALNVAWRVERAAAAPESAEEDTLDRLVREEFPPSAGELAQLFAKLARYDPYKPLGERFAAALASDVKVDEVVRRVWAAAGIDAPIGSLSSIASYYERGRHRGDLLENLASVLATKTTPTATHQLVARIAARHVKVARDERAKPGGTGGRRVPLDHLIITTNYDRLMELALEALEVPFVVLSSSVETPQVIAVASKHVTDRSVLQQLKQERNEPPASFALEHTEPIVVLYKMHGSIGDGPFKQKDSVVISDMDYVHWLSHMGSSRHMIPIDVGRLLRGSELLFLGYSLSDWNVRSFFNNVIKKRNEKSVERAAASTEEKPEELQPYPDYAVMNRFTVFDRAFFLENDISILHVDLGEFARHLGLALDAEDKRRP